jgi:hypothetical protein
MIKILVILLAMNCPVHVGQRVVLTNDGAVWVFHNRLLLEHFQNGIWDGDTVVKLSNVVDNGTKAIVTTACPNDRDNIVGVRILSGALKNRYGWVNYADVRTGR